MCVGFERLAGDEDGTDGPQRKRAWVLFAGMPHLSSLTHALREAGWMVDEIDTLIGGEAHNLASGSSRRQFAGQCKGASTS